MGRPKSPGDLLLADRAAAAWRQLQKTGWAAARNWLPSHVPIAYKLALVITLVISGGMVLQGLIIVENQSRLLQRQIENFGRTVVAQMVASSREPLLAGDALGLELIAANLIRNESVAGAAVFSGSGETVAAAGLVPAISPEQLSAEPVRLEWSGGFGSGTSMLSLTEAVGYEELTVGYVLVSFDRSVLEQSRDSAVRAITAATILMVILGIGGSLLAGNRLSRPIHQIMRATRRITQGDYRIRFKERRNDELGLLMESLNSMSEGLLRKEHVERAFSRYLSPKVAKQVLSDLSSVQLGGQRVEATVVFADIVGFTSLSEKLPPDEINALLNTYFAPIAQAAHHFHGHVDKYMGDCVMIVFGVPEQDEAHTLHALLCALTIQTLVEKLNHRRDSTARVRFRIGANSGTVLAGNMGSQDRMEYTVVGDAVNLASRLSHVAHPGQIIVTENMVKAELIAQAINSRAQDAIRVRGKKEAVSTYCIESAKPPFGDEIAAAVDAIVGEFPGEAV